MQLLLFLSSAIGFLFLTLLANEYRSENELFIYIAYMCVPVVFYFLGRAIIFYTDWNRETSISRRLKAKQRTDDYKVNLRKRLGR